VWFIKIDATLQASAANALAIVETAKVQHIFCNALFNLQFQVFLAGANSARL
jgi:hypothetical protein